MRSQQTGPSRFPISVTIAIVLGALFLTAGAGTAWADSIGADIPLLTNLVANSMEELSQLQESIQTLRASYEEVRTLAGYAVEADEAFKRFSTLRTADVDKLAAGSMERLFPDFGDLRAQPSNSGPWANATGELDSQLALCISQRLRAGSSLDGCEYLRKALTFEKSRRSVTETFGNTTDLTADVKALDHEAAAALSGTTSIDARSAKLRVEADALLRRCQLGGHDAPSRAECEAAAHTASVLQLEATSRATDATSENTRLTALQLAASSAERKRELHGTRERHDAIRAGAKALRDGPPRLTHSGAQPVELR